jgi:hypothetical protein
MSAFNELRRQAREKRDKVIGMARADYADTLVKIATLEQDLLGRESSRHKTISGSINSVLPTDRPFTTLDILAALEALDPGRVWRRRAIDHHIFRLRERGVVRRLRKAKGAELAQYVRVGVQVAALPFENKTLSEVMAEVLGDKAMSQTELAVAMLDAGYDTTMTPKALRDAVGVVLRRERRFVQRAGKWMKATTAN